MTTSISCLAAAAIAAVAFSSAPAGAQGFAPSGPPAVPPAFGEPVQMTVTLGDHGRRDHRRHRRGGRDFGGVLLYDRDYQGDTAWRSDSFNDWWHDRPDRAYPRWMQDNAKTCDRMWYSANVLRC